MFPLKTKSHFYSHEIIRREWTLEYRLLFYSCIKIHHLVCLMETICPKEKKQTLFTVRTLVWMSACALVPFSPLRRQQPFLQSTLEDRRRFSARLTRNKAAGPSRVWLTDSVRRCFWFLAKTRTTPQIHDQFKVLQVLNFKKSYFSGENDGKIN